MKPYSGVTSQRPKKGSSAPQNTAVGSGSRPSTKTSYPIKSSYPSSPQKLRG